MKNTRTQSDKKLAIILTLNLLLLTFGVLKPQVSFAANYQFAGPLSGPINQESAEFTLTTGGGFNGNIAIKITGGGLNYTERLNFDDLDISKSFTITPTTLGVVELVLTSQTSRPLRIVPSEWVSSVLRLVWVLCLDRLSVGGCIMQAERTVFNGWVSLLRPYVP